MNNLWKIHAPLMEEAGGEGGGGEPAKTEPTQTQEPAKTEPTQEPAKTEPTQEPTKTEPTQEPTKTEPAKEEQKNEEPKAPLENLLADDPEEPKKEEPKKDEHPKAEPTEEELKAFVDAVKKIDIGENVKWDDPLMEKIAPAIMELCDGKAEKSEKLVKLYTEAKQEEARILHEQRDNLQRGLVEECKKELGKDLKATCDLAKIGGQHIFGDEIWPIMRGVQEFANNVKIIKRLAMFGRSVKDDPGVIKKETAAGKPKRDWRESMYGGKK